LDIIWLRAATNNRLVQLDYVAKDNPIAAARLSAEIRRQIRQLREHPLIGRPGREPGTRELVLSRTPYIAVYRVMPSRIEILRILHGAQRWPRPPGSRQSD